MRFSSYPECKNETRKVEILNKMEDIYQMEIEIFGTASFDIDELKNMELEELEEFSSNY